MFFSRIKVDIPIKSDIFMCVIRETSIQIGGEKMEDQTMDIHPVDEWIDAIPEDKYEMCPCGCGMKFRFAMKDGIGKHETAFIEKFKSGKLGE